ncbi:hypothetical protein RCO27_00185 [Sphingosinicella sp. LHD-64]|uniref:COG3904 family protein n=1 Tax=Sphingosinicella sp. LHD-64 TaxID=3072139 RepID=UPI00280DA952|nr:hypothetical protein [Sphingosinicella sp. LHD-64]MDQ8754637.1 hypothetical protein [Sphingosinicella sp. LHD-64]
MRRYASFVALAALAFAQAAQAQRDPNNPTCPQNPGWSLNRQMTFTPQQAGGRNVLVAEGFIDDNLVPRLEAALRDNPQAEELWLRSPGGNARVGNQAGRIIREAGIPTRIPNGYACFSACNFLFMGGIARFVDNGGLFIVHMFTHTNNREVIRQEVAQGEDNTIGLIGEIEQQSALLASEDNDFLIRMGVSRNLLTEVMYRTSAVQDARNRETRRCLTQQEVNRYNVATTPWRGAEATPRGGGSPGNAGSSASRSAEPVQDGKGEK